MLIKGSSLFLIQLGLKYIEGGLHKSKIIVKFDKGSIGRRITVLGYRLFRVF